MRPEVLYRRYITTRAALNSISYLCSFPDQCLHILLPRYQQSSSAVPLHHPDQHNCCIRPHPRMFPNWRPTCVNSLPVVLSTTHHHFHPCLPTCQNLCETWCGASCPPYAYSYPISLESKGQREPRPRCRERYHCPSPYWHPSHMVRPNGRGI